MATDLPLWEEQYRELFHNAVVAMYRSKVDGSAFLAVNRKLCELFEYEEDELIGKPAKVLWASGAAREQMVRELRETGSLNNYECDIITKNGGIRTCLASTRLYPELGYLEGSLIDISERKAAGRTLLEVRESLERRVAARTAELQRSKELLDETGRLARVGGWSIDLQSNELSWTDAVYQIHEVGPEYRPTVETGINFYAPEAVPVISEAVRRAMQEGLPFDVELQLITAKKNKLWVRAIGEAIRENAKIVKVQGVFQDITKRKVAEDVLAATNRQLELSEATFRTISTSALDAIIMMDGNGNATFWNPAAEKIFGYSAGEIIGKSIHDKLAPPDSRNTFQAKFPVFKLMGTGAAINKVLELEALRKDGTAVPIEIALAGFKKDEEWVAVATIRDITSRKKAEESSKKLAAELEIIIDSIPGLVFFKDANNRFLRVNKFIADAHKMSKEEIEGKDGFDLYPREQAQGYWDDDLQVITSGKAKLNIEEPMDAGAGVRWFNTSKFPYTDETGKTVGVIGISLDITDRRRAEEERLEIERQQLHSQKLESLMVVTGGIAHDFGNLLQGIIGNMEMALWKTGETDSLRVSVKDTLMAARQAAELTKHLLTYTGGARFKVAKTNLSELVRNICQLRFSNPPENMKMNVEPAEDLPEIDGDAGQLKQVIANLATNALEALKEKRGEVKITTGVQDCDAGRLAASLVEPRPGPGRFVYVQVADSGCGMDDDTKHRIFEPFFSTKFTGRGLGLAAVSGIVRSHKGAIFVESEAGKGTTVTALFPVPPRSA